MYFFGSVERNAYSVYVVVNFLSQIIFIFPLFQLHLHTLPCPKTEEEQQLPEIKKLITTYVELTNAITLHQSKVSFRGQKMPESCPDWSPSMSSPGSCCFPISQQQPSCLIGKQEDPAWVSFGVWSHLGVKKVLAMPGLLSFNFKLMSKHPFHFPMGVLTPDVFYCSEEVFAE